MTCPKCQQPLSIAQRQRPFVSFARKPVSCRHCAAILQMRITAPQRWWAAMPWVGLASLTTIITKLDRIRLEALAGLPVDPASLSWFAVLIPLITIISVWCAVKNYRETRVSIEAADKP